MTYKEFNKFYLTFIYYSIQGGDAGERLKAVFDAVWGKDWASD